MRSPASRVQLLRDLHFALEVMEERSHMGLDDQRAKTVKSALLRRIHAAEAGRDYERSAAMPEPGAKEVLSA